MRDISKIVDAYIPSELWDYEPVIAGGFALWVYMLSMDNDSTKKIYDGVIESVTESAADIHYSSKTFSDVDIWFRDSSEFHEFSDYTPLDTLQGSDDQRRASINMAEECVSDIFNFPSKIVRASQWANTFQIQSEEETSGILGFIASIVSKNSFSYFTTCKYQFLKKPVASIEEDLFDEFDFLNCCVAIVKKDGNYSFVVREGVEKAIRSGKLESNNRLPKREFGLNVYSCVRAFRYHAKFGWDFSERLTDEIFDVYCEIVDNPLSKKPEEEDNITLFNLSFATVSANEDLDSESFMLDFTTEVPESLIVKYINSAISDFGIFIRMDAYKEEYNLFFINTQIPDIDKEIERYYK